MPPVLAPPTARSLGLSITESGGHQPVLAALNFRENLFKDEMG